MLRQEDGMEGCACRKYRGDRGEEAAARYLKSQGYEIIERNWRCKEGEADIIAVDEDEIVFVEVKTRSNDGSGLPEEAVTRNKRRRYEGVALSYISENSWIRAAAVRFDVVSITLIGEDRAFLRHHRNAFGRGD